MVPGVRVDDRNVNDLRKSELWRGTSVKLGKDGTLRGRIKIKDGDESTFIAERTAEPAEPIPDPPSYRDKWGPRRRR